MCEIEETAPLAVVGIEYVLRYWWQALGRDHQHVRSMLAERTSRHRSGEDAGEVQHADPVQGTAVLRKRLRVALTDLGDLDDRFGGEPPAMRMGKPLVIGAHHTAADARLVDGRLEIERVPRGHGRCDRLRIG